MIEGNLKWALGIGAMLLAVVASAAKPHLEGGLWEVTAKTKVAGMPMQIPTQTHRQCMESTDFSDPKGVLPAPQSMRGGEQCRVEDYHLAGDTARWTLKCTGPQSITGNGEVTFGTTEYHGTMKMNGMKGPQGPMVITTSFNGRRLGACKSQ